METKIKKTKIKKTKIKKKNGFVLGMEYVHGRFVKTNKTMQ